MNTWTRTFFHRTYLTRGLSRLISAALARFPGLGWGESQYPKPSLPFYHRAREWGVRTAILAGASLAFGETPWGLLAEKLISLPRFTDPVAPGWANWTRRDNPVVSAPPPDRYHPPCST